MNILNALEQFCGYELVKTIYEPLEMKYRLRVWYEDKKDISDGLIVVWGESPDNVVENVLAQYEIKTGKQLKNLLNFSLE